MESSLIKQYKERRKYLMDGNSMYKPYSELFYINHFPRLIYFLSLYFSKYDYSIYNYLNKYDTYMLFNIMRNLHILSTCIDDNLCVDVKSNLLSFSCKSFDYMSSLNINLHEFFAVNEGDNLYHELVFACNYFFRDSIFYREINDTASKERLYLNKRNIDRFPNSFLDKNEFYSFVEYQVRLKLKECVFFEDVCYHDLIVSASKRFIKYKALVNIANDESLMFKELKYDLIKENIDSALSKNKDLPELIYSELKKQHGGYFSDEERRKNILDYKLKKQNPGCCHE